MVKNDFCALGLLQKCSVGNDGLDALCESVMGEMQHRFLCFVAGCRPMMCKLMCKRFFDIILFRKFVALVTCLLSTKHRMLARKLINSPTYQLINSTTYQLINSSTYQLINLPTHQLTNS